MGSVALGWRRVWERDTQTEKWLFYSSQLIQNRASFKILSFKLLTYSFKLHERMSENHDVPSKQRCVSLIVTLSPSLSSSFSISTSVTLVQESFSFYFLSYLHISGSTP